MLDAISNFFNKHLKSQDNSDDDSAVDKYQLASAALLIELSKADSTIDERETETLIKILKEKFSLPDEALSELFSLAQQANDEATSLYQFTTLINDEYTYLEKNRLLKNMWEVAYADGNLDRYEESFIRKVAELMYITHSDYIKTKLAVKNMQ